MLLNLKGGVDRSSYVRRNEGVRQVQCHNRHRRRLGSCFAMQTGYRFILIHLLLAMSFVALGAVMFVGESTKDRCCTSTHDAGPHPHSLIRCRESMQVQMDGALAANSRWPALDLYFSLILLISNCIKHIIYCHDCVEGEPLPLSSLTQLLFSESCHEPSPVFTSTERSVQGWIYRSLTSCSGRIVS